MITNGINFKNFLIKKKSKQITIILNHILNKKNQVIQSLSSNYKDSFNIKILNKYKKFKNFRVIGIGGSSLGTEAIYNFLRKKIKKNFSFINDLDFTTENKKDKNCLNLVVSKSGETLETIVNSNIIINKKDENLIITENKDNYLYKLAQKLKAQVIHHNNFIGGRYSVLSETGMLPAQLMGLDSKKFRQLNNLVKNKKYLNALISNVSSIIFFIKKKKYNSIIINYDKSSENLFFWYQQLIAESLGKKKKGLLPIVSSMPKDNHSVMQLYLDGFTNNFFTFFFVHEKGSQKIIDKNILSSKKFLKKKRLMDITYAQKQATENIFKKKGIPFRSFEIFKRDEKTLGELFNFFILETILLGHAMKVNPYDQPAVELIKKETKKILI
ncbi:glucose-6-phosphate isomerase [Candidatus Pelagibacter sp.]|nr:glucose-6-phosphate isomerase [Candidatus Pelagibacter sp.]